MTINENLTKLYTDHLKGIENVSYNSLTGEGDDTYSKLDGPILMHCWEDQYNTASSKILFVGQEASGSRWGWAQDDIREPLEWYEKFALGESYKKGCFWKALKYFNRTLNPNSGSQCFLWTNVSKYSTWQGRPISFDEHKFIISEMNLLPEEINIIKPDVIIFLSGPNYDEKIKIQFEGNIEFEEIHDNIPKRELARLKHPLLPQNTFRTYHPSALQRQNKWEYLTLLLAQIQPKNI